MFNIWSRFHYGILQMPSQDAEASLDRFLRMLRNQQIPST